MRNPAPVAIGMLISWLVSLALAALVARLFAGRRPRPRVGQESDRGSAVTAAGANPVASLFDAVLAPGGSLSFARASLVGIVFTLICAIALVVPMVSGGFVTFREIRYGLLLEVLAAGLAITILPHYLLCRWLADWLRRKPGNVGDWLMARVFGPFLLVFGVMAGAFVVMLGLGVYAEIGRPVMQAINPFPTIPNLFIIPGDFRNDTLRGTVLVGLFAMYGLGLQASWPLAALFADAVRGAARAAGRPWAVPEGTGAMTVALMALATALHLILLPVLW